MIDTQLYGGTYPYGSWLHRACFPLTSAARLGAAARTALIFTNFASTRPPSAIDIHSAFYRPCRSCTPSLTPISRMKLESYIGHYVRFRGDDHYIRFRSDLVSASVPTSCQQ